MANDFFRSPLDSVTDSLPKFELPQIQEVKTEAPAEETRRPATTAKADSYLPSADIRPIFEAAAREFDVPVNVLMALGHQESRFNPNAIGPTTKWGRAKGMMQYLDSTASGLGINPFDPTQAIPAAAKQLRERLDKGYSMEDAVKEHFAGPDRKLWGEKTAIYGREVMDKVGKIGELMGALGSGPERQNVADTLAELNKDEPGRYVAIDENKLSTNMSTGLPKDLYEHALRLNNPGAPESFFESALKDWEASNAARTQAGANRVQQQFDVLKSPEETFQQRLDQRLAGPKQGIIPQLPTRTDVVADAEKNKTNERGFFSRNMDYLGADLKIGWNNLINSFEGMRASEYGELLQSFERKYTPEQIAADPKLQAELKARQEGYARSMAAIQERNAINEKLYGEMRPETKQFFSASDKPTMEQLATIGDAVMKNPVGVITDLGVQSGPQSLAMVAAAIAARLSGATATGAAVAGGGASGVIQFGGDYAELRHKGMPHEEAWRTAAAKSAVVGSFDAVSMNSAGKALDTVLGAGGVLKKAGTVAKELGKQAGLGMAGEAGGSVASGRPINATDVAAEGLGELFGGPVEAIGTFRQGGKKPVVGQPAQPQPTADPADAAAQVQAVTVTPPAPSQAAGPLTRAIENTAEQPERVKAETPYGPITGFVQAHTEDAAGNSVTRVLGDDGQVYTFTSADGVQIKPEAGPLTGALEKAAEQSAPAEQQVPAGEPAPGGADVSASTDAAGAPAAIETPVRNVKKDDEPEKRLEDMTEAELRARMKYLASQAKNTGGWNKMLIAERKKVEAQINKRVAEAAKAEKAAEVTPAAEPVKTEPAAPEQPDAEGYFRRFIKREEVANELAAELGGRVVQNEKGSFDIVKGAEDGRNAADLQVRDDRDASAEAAAPAEGNQQGAGEGSGAADAGRRSASGQPAPGAGAAVPGADEAANAGAALTNEYAGKWFGSKEKADAFLSKKKATGTHEVVQTGKVRFEIQPKPINQEPIKNENSSPATVSEQQALSAQESIKKAEAVPAQSAQQQQKENENAGRLDFGAARPETAEGEQTAARPAGQPGRSVQGQGKAAAEEVAAGETAKVQDETIADPRAASVELNEISEATFKSWKKQYGEGTVNGWTVATDPLDVGLGRHVLVSPYYMARFDSADASRAWAKQNRAADFYTKKETEPQAATGETAGDERVVDLFGNGSRVQYFNDKRGTYVESQSYPSGRVGWRAGEVIDGQEFWLSDKEFQSKQDAQDAIRGLRASNTIKAKSAQKYGAIPSTWDGEAKKAAKAIIDAGVVVDRMSSSTQSKSKYIYTESGLKVRLADHALPSAYDAPDVDYRYGGDVNALAKEVAKKEREAQQEPQAAAGGARPEPAANTEPTPPNGGKPDPFAKNKIFTADKVASARERMKAKLGQLNSGIDPELMMYGMTIAGAYIESGVRSFADYAKAMTDDFGDKIKPYLLSFYEAARNYPGVETEGMTPAAEAKRQHAELIAQPTAAPILEGEGNANDTQPAKEVAGDRAQGQEPGAVREPEGVRDAGRDDAADRGPGRAVDRGSEAAGDRGGNDRGQSGLRGEPSGTDANAQQPVSRSRGDGAATGGRGAGHPRSSVANYRIHPGELKREGSWRATAERNVQIVELVKRITAEDRQATPEERALLAKFTGWGASEIANGVFPDRYGRYKDANWQALGERLKSALTEEEYAQARRTTQYAHYTSEGVIRSIYTGLQRLGFAGGSVVEPGMGVGHFNGLMPDGMAANSRYTGIEYDTLTGQIAKLLYPESNIIVGDYTRTNLPRDFFDAAIGNPPFSGTQILSDPEYKNRRPMLHDYFFMKTIDRVKPGGVLVFVTSKGTMDKASDKSRKYLAERANLLGAVRLPQTAFKDNAGTEVVTDVIFLQKRGPGIADNGVQWLGTKEVTTPQGPAAINEYFADNPGMVLGTHALQGSMYRANEYTVLPPEGDIEELFAKAVQRLPENIFRPTQGSQAERAAVQDRDFNPKHKKEGGLYLSDDGKLMQVENGSGVELTHRTNAEGKQIALTPKQRKWLRDYVGLRDALKQAQYDQLNDGDWQKSLKALNKSYGAFAKEHGPILDYTVIERENADGTTTVTKRYKNEPLLRIDAEGALAYALEQVKEDGTIIKGAVLNERVLERPRDPEIKTTNDALFVSLNRNGSLVLDDVAALAGTDKESVIRDLGTTIYDAPGKGWQLADEYLSGNVVRKLKEARAAAEVDPRYKRNVEALLAVQPRPLGPTDITVRLGANWVPPSDIGKFADEVIGESINVGYNPILNRWDIEQTSRNLTEWGFDKMTAGQILDGVLNNRQLKVTWRDNEGKTHVDLEATEKANDIAGKMRDRFRSWVWTDTKRSERLVNYYNENFNNIAPRQFDGSHLTLPGVSSRYKLYPHQKRAVWRIVQQGDTYLAHAVGAGKTMEMIAGGMEERRLGIISKPMYVVPNHMLAQFSREFLELYPTANIMVADEHNFHTHNRKRFVAQAALNNPDAIVITHAAFGRIGMSDEFYSDFIGRQIDAWKEALDDAEGDRITTKQIERRIEQLEQRIEGRQGKDKKDQVLTFEELGVDKLFVDEFHEFRKLDFATNQGNVKGIDPNGSQRALDLSMKVEYLRGKKPGRSLVAASGTPVTNTMGELYTAQRFFQPDQLKEDGLDNFDAWASQYGDIVTGFEQNAAGGYEMVARFARFQNVPELMRRVRSFMDILTGSNLGELVVRPDVTGGARSVDVTPVPNGYKDYQQQLQARIKAIRNRKGPPKKGDDIILNVIGDGRFSAIDMRFVDPTLPSDPNSKLNLAIDNIIKAYRETADFEYAGKDGKPEPLKGSSIILFTDIGLGEQSAATRGFDMRAWIEKRLIDEGIPREHIAFMRDHKQHAKKERLFADMREGKKRILIGGKEMETGTNVQKRLSHLFHLDAPWFPASVEQREGRIVRQGNQNKQVAIKAFATKGSYDSTMWGMNARKASFIEQAMNGDDSVRSLEDVSEASAFEMAAALASGDERYMKLAGLKADVEKLERLRQAHYDDQNRLAREKHWAEETIKRNTGRVEEIEAAIAKRHPIKAGEFLATVVKKPYDNREEFSQAVFKEFQKLASKETEEETVGQIGGFPIKFYGQVLKGDNYAAALHVDLPGDPDPLLVFPLDPETAVSGIATRAANQVNSLDRHLIEAKSTIDTSKRKIEQIDKRLGAAFPEESLLLEKVAELGHLEAELAAEGAAANADAAAATAETEWPKFSVAAEPAPTFKAVDTNSPEFKRWFGDSKVVDAEGRPLVVYHGTNADFDAFSLKNRGMLGGGFYFTKNHEVAAYFSGSNQAESRGTVAPGARTIPVYLSLKNPLRITDATPAGEGRVVINGKEESLETLPPAWLEDAITKGGHDGVEVFGRNAKAPSWFMVRSPEQIKSAIGNRGTFDPANPDIRFSVNADGATVAEFGPVTESFRASARSETIKERTGLGVGALREAITTGMVGSVIGTMIDNGLVVLHENTSTLPSKANAPRGVQAVTLANGQIHLVAEALTPQNARPVLLHELFHMGGERLVGSRQWGNLMGRGASLFRQSEKSSGKAREFFDRARNRVAAAKRQGAVSTKLEVEEFLAYAIEEYERGRDAMPASIRKWVEDFIGYLKAWMLTRFGKQLGEVTPAQLSAMAKAVIMGAAVAYNKGAVGPEFNGKFSAIDQAETPAFKRWFGDSVVTDNGKPMSEGGKPLVVYHGTPHDFSRFKPSRNGVFGRGIYMTTDANDAENFAYGGDANGDNIMPLYASIVRPYKIDFRDSWQDLYHDLTGDEPANTDKEYPSREQEKRIHEALISAGHDGIEVYGAGDMSTSTFYIAFRPEQIKSAIGNRGTFDPANPDIRYSVAPEKALDEAEDALDEPKVKDDYIGRVVKDFGWKNIFGEIYRLIIHPRQVAVLHPEFTPVYMTGISQMETRDKNIADFGADVHAYDHLDQAGKENVNKVLELGRLTASVYSAEELRNGVANTGEKEVVTLVDGKPRMTTVPMTALLTEIGEVVKLTDDEAKAYQDLRAMFDRALDRMRDQTLEEMGFPEFVGVKNAAREIMARIDKNTPPEQAERLTNIAKFVAEIEQAKRAGYVPFARYGDYVVTVKEKVADVTFLEDSGPYLIAHGLPDSFAPELMDMGAEKTDEGWKIKDSQRQAVERMTEQTIYSAKVETGLGDRLGEMRASKVDKIPAVRDAIEKAKSEWIGDNPNRRIVAFKVREKKSDQPVKLSDVDALAEVASIDNATWDAIRDKLADAIKSKGFRRHFFHSDNIPGYTGDFERSIADYVIGMSGYLSRRQHAKKWENSVTAIKDKPKLYTYATKYRDYVNNPQEELAMVRQIGFFSYIAGVMASAFANLTQVPLLTMPTLSQVAPVALASKEVGKAYLDAFKMFSLSSGLDMFDPEKAPEDVRGILKEAWADGSFVPLESFDLMMTARQRNVGARKGVKAFNTTTQVASAAFTLAERVNRLVTFIAAARLAEKRAVQENAKKVLSGDALARADVLRNWSPKSFAEWAVDESQYRMGKANRPTTMRGVGSAIMQFKGFMLQTFEAWYRMAALHGKEGKFAAASSLMAMYALAGLWGLPGADDLRKLIENIYKQITDKDLDLKTELRAWIARKSGSNTVATMVNKGVPYVWGVDLTRVGMGTVAPDSPLAAAGIPFDMLIGRPKRAFEKASAGDELGAAAELTPNFIKHWLVSGSWALEGVRDKRGNRILLPSELSAGDLAMKSLGFQPSIVTDIRDYEYAERRMETSVDALKRSYTNKLAKAIVQAETTTDQVKLKEIDDQIAKIYADIDEHNSTATQEQLIRIDQRTLRGKIMREAEGVKSTWGRERKAARQSAQELRGVFGLSPQGDDE